MNMRTYLLASATVFGIVALVHAVAVGIFGKQRRRI